MRRLILLLSLFALASAACTWSVQTFPPTAESPMPPETDSPDAASAQDLEGPDIDYNGIRFTLDPALGSRLYAFEDTTSIDGATAHNTRFALSPEEYCQTWCVMVYPVADFEQAFGTFVFPPSGYRGGAAIIFEAQKKALSYQNGSGNRSLEIFGQSQYGVSNESLKYVFRGYSTDKQYGVYVQIPIHAATLPDVAPTLDFNSQEVLDYNEEMTESINALMPTDFAPSLDLLDALVASIRVETP
jgi:hypothetical protein